MTKFEEELKRPDNGPITELNNNMQEVFSQYRKMREYATQLEDKLEQKDNQFQKLLEQNVDWSQECNNINQINAQLTKENEDLKSQLQQQALPVVPECVAVAIEKDKQANVSISDVFEATFSYENHHLTEAGLWTKNNPEEYIVARNIGYTVEKPQLFYLKHIDMSKRDPDNSDWYLIKDHQIKGKEGLDHGRVHREETPEEEYFKFTQQEIDSMQTGSYEQIEVEK